MTTYEYIVKNLNNGEDEGKEAQNVDVVSINNNNCNNNTNKIIILLINLEIQKLK